MTRTVPLSRSRLALPRPLRWAREQLFNSPFNTALTVVLVVLLAGVGRAVLDWAFTAADWAVIPANFRLFMVGTYPEEQIWRVWAGLIAISLAAGFQWGQVRRPGRRALGLIALVAAAAFVLGTGRPSGLLVPAAVLAVAAGLGAARTVRASGPAMAAVWAGLFLGFVILIGADFGQGGVPSTRWGGLLLTAILSLVAIVASFPLGVLLAIGRNSTLPVVSRLCTLYIEVVRGVPLVAVLFMAQLFVPLFLPDFRIEKVVRAMIGLTLFSAAYTAEIVRGGLQAVGTGQSEAARALGLSAADTMALIVLPQALRAVIPAMVGQFIQLFKDTSLVAIIGLTDLLGVGHLITANPAWVGRFKEVFLAIALIYGICSYTMSLASRRLERRLGVGKR